MIKSQKLTRRYETTKLKIKTTTYCRLLDEPGCLDPLEIAIEKLCRNAYYGTAKAQKLAEGALPLLIWILNRRKFPEEFTIKVHKCVSELCWTSLSLKKKVGTTLCDFYVGTFSYIFTPIFLPISTIYKKDPLILSGLVRQLTRS